jgi:hypothetical protein
MPSKAQGPSERYARPRYDFPWGEKHHRKAIKAMGKEEQPRAATVAATSGETPPLARSSSASAARARYSFRRKGARSAAVRAAIAYRGPPLLLTGAEAILGAVAAGVIGTRRER